MKALIVYYTMGGRTKKAAKAIASSMTKYEVDYFPVELTGRFIEKIKMFDKFENGDYSAIEPGLSSLDAKNYDLLLFGMPTYGNRPPKTFDEIINRMANLAGKKTIVFTTARFTGKGTLQYMKEEIETKNAQVINQKNFRRFFWLGKKKAIKFGKEINEK